MNKSYQQPVSQSHECRLGAEIAVVICTYERPQHLRNLLHSLAKVRDLYALSIYIIDQSHDDKSGQVVSSLAPMLPAGRLHYHRVTFVGLARARNYAIRRSTELLLAFTDDDCLVTEDWVEQIRWAFDDAATDAVFGQVQAYSAGDDFSYHRFRCVWGETAQARRADGYTCDALNLRNEASTFSAPCLPYANLGSGNNMAYRRRIFMQHGLFYPDLGAGTRLRAAEDTEFQYRLLSAGCKLRYNPDMVVYHNGWRSPEATARLLLGYDKGLIAVFTAYALRGNPLAARFLAERVIECYCRKLPDRRVFPPALWAITDGLVGGWQIYHHLRRALP